MMHTLTHRPGKVLDITLKGKVTKADYERILPTLENEIYGGGTENILWDMSGMDSIEPGAVWEDFKFDIKHRGEFDRIAIVGDSGLHEWAAKLLKPIAKADVEYFDEGQRSEAAHWVSHGVREMA